MTYQQFVNSLINMPGSVIHNLLPALRKISPAMANDLEESSLNPQVNPTEFANAIKWLQAAWPEEGIEGELPPPQSQMTERMGRAMNVLLATQRRSRKDLCQITGISYPYLSEFAVGKKMPSQPKLMSIANALGVSLSELMKMAADLPEVNT